MPGQNSQDADASALENSASHTGNHDATRRTVIKQRARELKRALLEATLHLSPEDAGSAYRAAIRERKPATHWGRLCLLAVFGWLAGALSMLVPVGSSHSVPLPLRAAVAASVASHPPDLSASTLIVPASHCEHLRFDRPASITLSTDGHETGAIPARIAKLIPGDAAASTATCELELQPLGPTSAAEGLRDLASDVALDVQLPMQPRTWVAALMDHENAIGQRSPSTGELRAYVQQLRRESLALLADLAQDTELGRVLTAQEQTESTSNATIDSDSSAR